MSELKPHNGNPFTKEELSPGDLHQLFPDTQQLGNEPLTKLLYLSCLGESSEWKDGSAMGETAFWLKILSMPKTDELRQQKRVFKENLYRAASAMMKEGTDCPMVVVKTVALNDYETASDGQFTPSDKSAAEAFGIEVSEGDQIIIETTTNSVRSVQSAAAKARTKKDGDHVKKQHSVVRRKRLRDAEPQGTADDLKMYCCRVCGEGFHTVADRMKHVDESHQKELPFACPVGCGYRSAYSWNTANHVKSRHADHEFLCKECPFTTCHRHLLERHIREKHSGPVSLKCPHCDWTGRTTCVRNQHIKLKHSQGRHQCKFCDYSSHAVKTLRTHMNAVHTKSELLTCKACGFSTYNDISMVTHVRTHQKPMGEEIVEVTTHS